MLRGLDLLHDPLRTMEFCVWVPLTAASRNRDSSPGEANIAFCDGSIRTISYDDIGLPERDCRD